MVARRFMFRLSVAILWLASFALARGAAYDLVIRGGRIVDGTGNPAFFGDVAISKGRIADVGHIIGTAPAEIDARGMIVAPGFIDVHTHADDAAQHPLGENFLRMGVTTVVVGNCGSSTLDVSNLFHQLEQTPVALNVATLVGHNSVRERAMGGSFDRPPTPEELEKMKALVAKAMQDGAVGFSTGLIYVPGVFAKTDEIIALAKVAAAYDGIYTTHMRHEDYRIFEALDEAFAIARAAHIRLEVSHIKLSSDRAWGQADKVLAYIERARAEGLDVTQDQYAYTASSTTLRSLIPDSAFDGGHQNFLKTIADPAGKSRLAAAIKDQLSAGGRKDFSYAVIASYPHDPSLNGLSIVEAAQKIRHGESLDDQVETVLDIEKNGGGDGVFHGMNEDDLRIFMRHPNTMIASDSGNRVLGQGAPHPRGYGNNARVLGRYVRELKVLRLEDAIRKMTSLPAATFQLRDRGQLRPGNWADIVVFDPEKVIDEATYTNPHQYPEGIPYVLVNGAIVIDQGKHTGAKPGMPLRHLAPPLK